MFNGLTLTPTSAGLTAPVSGNSDGYQWGGSVDGSVTVKTSTSNLANFVIAQGGGAGAQVSTYSGGAILGGNSGLWGWTQGGFPMAPGGAPGAGEWIFGSNAGGAGGDATEPNYGMSYAGSTATNSMISSAGYQTTSYFNGIAQYMGTVQIMDRVAYYGGGVASYPVNWNTPNNQYPFINAGAGGPGIQGYGAGGNGHWQTGSSSVGNNRGLNKGKGAKFLNNFSISGGSAYSKLDITQNTGNGGSGVSYFQNSNLGLEGQSGSSGLVIVRWYE